MTQQLENLLDDRAVWKEFDKGRIRDTMSRKLSMNVECQDKYSMSH